MSASGALQIVPSEIAEPVRLVIWDLDETFWKGTLTEGGIEFQEENRSIIIELARRGIVSSICSKNDFEKTKSILESYGVWEYFVLPSISWEPKGPRIRDLIQSIQLRPATVMFIDDNPMNLQEARNFEPELQISDQHIVPQLLAHPLFKGKDDSGLKRLNQYKLLEQRHRDQQTAAGDVEEFLRASGVRVEINYDVMSNLDRALELITRTNQLNFTKTKMPVDADQAREELKKLLNEFHVHAGLIRVVDRYGDHGYCGIYVTRNMQQHLLHFCFSCRILGMGVETWIYRKLGRPHLHIQGEVLNDVKNDQRSVDWIQLLSKDAASSQQASSGACRFFRVGARGGCDLEALTHYFRPRVKEVRGEFATSRHWVQFRIENSMVMRYAVAGATQEVLHAYGLLGYQPAELQTSYGKTSEGPALWLLSFIVDNTIALYRHKASGVLVPFQAPGIADDRDVRGLTPDDLIEQGRNAETAQYLGNLAREFDYEGGVSERQFKENLTAILDSAPADTTVVLVLCSEQGFNRQTGRTYEYQRGPIINRWMREVVSGYPAVSFLDMRSLVQDISELDGQFHFDRIVYFRAYQELARRFSFEA